MLEETGRMETHIRQFDEDNLKKVISSAVLMSSIDGEVHENEWEVIETFAKKYWKDEYQEFEEYELSVKKEIDTLLKDKFKFQPKLDALVEHLTDNLNSQQKNIMLNLVGDVMVADNIMTLEETKLFSTFMEKLGIWIY